MIDMKKNILSACAVAASAVLMASCCGTPDIDGKWNILEANGEKITVIGDEKPYIEFNTEESKVHGYTGCNLMNGAYTQDGRKISFGNMATTMMAGPDENMKAERSVLDAIGKAVSVKAEGENLLLLDEGKNIVMELGR